jgi:hypothetical protein
MTSYDYGWVDEPHFFSICFSIQSSVFVREEKAVYKLHADDDDDDDDDDKGLCNDGIFKLLDSVLHTMTLQRDGVI